MHTSLAVKLFGDELEFPDIINKDDSFVSTIELYNKVIDILDLRTYVPDLPEIKTKKQAADVFQVVDITYPAEVINTLNHYYTDVFQNGTIYCNALVNKYPFEEGSAQNADFYNEIKSSLLKLQNVKTLYRSQVNSLVTESERLQGYKIDLIRWIYRNKGILSSVKDIKGQGLSDNLSFQVSWQDACPATITLLYLIKRSIKQKLVRASLIKMIHDNVIEYIDGRILDVIAYALSDIMLVQPGSLNTPSLASLIAEYILAVLQESAFNYIYGHMFYFFSIPSIDTTIEKVERYPTIENVYQKSKIGEMARSYMTTVLHITSSCGSEELSLLPIASMYIHDVLSVKEQSIRQIYDNDIEVKSVKRLLYGEENIKAMLTESHCQINLNLYNAEFITHRYLFRQTKIESLPKMAFGIILRDSHCTAFPCLMAVNNDNLFTLLIPNSSNTMNYLFDVYGFADKGYKKMDPLKGYGPITKHFLYPENAPIKLLFKDFKIIADYKTGTTLHLKACTPELVNINSYVGKDVTDTNPNDLFWEVPFLYAEFYNRHMSTNVSE